MEAGVRDAGHGVVARIEANAAFRANPPDHLTELELEEAGAASS